MHYGIYEIPPFLSTITSVMSENLSPICQIVSEKFSLKNPKLYNGYGFSLSFKLDNKDIKIGGLAIKCCRQFKAFTPSLYPFYPKRGRLRPQSRHFFSRLPSLNENPEGFIRLLTFLLLFPMLSIVKSWKLHKLLKLMSSLKF